MIIITSKKRRQQKKLHFGFGGRWNVVAPSIIVSANIGIVLTFLRPRLDFSESFCFFEEASKSAWPNCSKFMSQSLSWFSSKDSISHTCSSKESQVLETEFSKAPTCVFFK